MDSTNNGLKKLIFNPSHTNPLCQLVSKPGLYNDKNRGNNSSDVNQEVNTLKVALGVRIWNLMSSKEFNRFNEELCEVFVAQVVKNQEDPLI